MAASCRTKNGSAIPARLKGSGVLIHSLRKGDGVTLPKTGSVVLVRTQSLIANYFIRCTLNKFLSLLLPFVLLYIDSL